MSNKSYAGMLASATIDEKPIRVKDWPTEAMIRRGNLYCTPQQMATFYDQRTISQLASDNGSPSGKSCLQQVLDSAADELETHLRGRVELPIKGEIPGILTKWVAVKSASTLFARRSERPESVIADDAWANNWIAMFVDGRVTLPKPKPAAVDLDAALEYAACPFPRESMVGNLPDAMANVNAQDLAVTVNQLQRDAFAFMAKYDCRATALKIKLPNWMEGPASVAFRTGADEGNRTSSISTMVVKKLLYSKAHQDPSRACEYWIEGGGVLCRIISVGGWESTSTEQQLPQAMGIKHEQQVRDSVERLREEMIQATQGAKDDGRLALAMLKREPAIPFPSGCVESVTWQQWKAEWDAASPADRSKYMRNGKQVPRRRHWLRRLIGV